MRTERPRQFPGSTAGAYLVATVVFLGLGLLVVRPGMLTDCGGSVFGGPGDSTGGWIWHEWNLDTLGAGPFQTTTPLSAYPVGGALWQPHFVTWTVLLLPGWVLTKALGPVCGYNVELLAGLVASAVAMFGLVRWLTRRNDVSVLAGGVFALGPYAQVKALGHLNYVHVWVFPLLIWSVLALWREPGWRRAAVVGAAVALAGYTDGYYLVLAPVLAAALLVAWILAAVREGRDALVRRLGLTAAAGGVAVGLLLPVAVTMLSSSSDVRAVVSRTEQEISIYSARPWEYVVPSRFHPVWDDLFGDWQERQLHRSNFSEQTLYVGVPTLMGAIGFAAWAWRRRRAPEQGRFPVSSGLLAAGLGLAVLGAAALSFPPWLEIGGRRLPLPTRVFFELPLWRVVARFSIPLRAALVVMAAMGLAVLLGRLRRPAIVVAALVPLLAFDSLGSAGFERWSYAANADPAYEWLADQPHPTPIAEYPLFDDIFHSQHQQFQTFQQVHRQPTLNGALWATDFGWITAGLSGLADPQTIPALRRLGIELVTVHPSAFRGPVGEPPSDLVIARRGDAMDVYRLGEGPSGTAVLGVGEEGWFSSEHNSFEPLRWLGDVRGEMGVFRLDNRDGRVCAGFTVASFGPARRVSLTQGQRVLWEGEVTAPVPVSFVAETGTPIEIAAEPGPIRVSDLIGGPDDRTVSVSISGLRATTNLTRCAEPPPS